eukprot:c8389_g1_i1.p1 GENE.c8389_g1_i1~~c8389_g1_i1.p1  ORF type:complete len:1134 (+),score=246.39 c8389_g1_i1:42-3443(+)
MSDQIKQTVELACHQFETAADHASRVAAEQVLVSFRNSPRPYASAQYIIEHSLQPLAVFHSFGAIKDGLAREWPSLTDTDKRNITTWVSNYLSESYGRIQPYVRKEASSAIAVAYKRGLTEESTTHISAAFLATATQLAQSAEPDKMRAGFEIISAITAEMASSFMRGSNLTWAFHEHSRKRFETTALQPIFHLCLNTLSLTRAGTICDQQVLRVALELCQDILSWEYSAPIGRIIMRLQLYAQKRGRSGVVERKPLRPPESWKSVLINFDLLVLFFELYRQLRVTNEDVAQICRQSLIQLVSLQGAIFGTDEATKVAFFTACTNQTVDLTQSVMRQAVTSNFHNANEVVDICWMYLFLIRSFRADLFLGLCSGQDPSTNALVTMLHIMQACLAANTNSNLDEDIKSAALEAMDVLLTAWMLLADVFMGTPTHTPTFPDAVRKVFCETTHQAFTSYCQCYVHAAAVTVAEEYNQFLDASAEDDRLDCIAALGRVSPSPSLALITHLISSRSVTLRQLIAAGQGQSPQAGVVSEELCVAISLIGHILADSGIGERPAVPESVLLLSDQSSKAGEDQVITASSVVLQHIDMEVSVLASGGAQQLSPYLAETSTKFANRWSKTYLMPDPNLHSTTSRSLWNHFGAEGVDADQKNITQIIQLLLSKIVSDFTHWAGEATIMKETTGLLLQLVKRSQMRPLLNSLPQWAHITQGSTNDNVFPHLTSKTRRRLIECVVRGCNVGDREREIIEPKFRALAAPLVGRTQSLAVTVANMSSAQHPAVVQEITRLCDLYRGFSHATEMVIQPVLFDIVFDTLDFWVSTVEKFPNNELVLSAVLKLFRHFIEAHMFYTESPRDQALVAKALRLLQVLSQTPLSPPATRHEEETRETHIRHVIQLIVAIVNGDTVTVAERSEDSYTSQVVLFGMKMVMGMISQELMKFTRLCDVFFEALSFICQSYSEEVCVLPHPQFSLLMTLFVWGIGTSDSNDAKEKCFDCIVSICCHHLGVTPSGLTRPVSNGKPHQGLRLQLQQNPGLLNQLLSQLIKFFLFAVYEERLFETGCDAVFATALCSESSCQTVIAEIVASQPAELQPIWQEITSKLFTANGLAAVFDRKNKTTFQKNLQQLVIDARCISTAS